jgi:hypothetical protein
MENYKKEEKCMAILLIVLGIVVAGIGLSMLNNK